MNRIRAVQQEWRVDDLARALHVSPLTIRRDLDCLEKNGVIVRTHGGCMAITRIQNSIYQKHVAANFEMKQSIGNEAMKEVKQGDVLLINDGSTTFHLASCLKNCGRITVYTNSIAMIGEISRFSNVHLYILGGRYHSDLFYLGGSLMERVLETIEADTIFIGTDAIDRTGRCLVMDQDMARTTQMMIRRGRRKILLADGTKVGKTGNVVYGTLRDFDLWITTDSIPSSALRRFRKQTEIRVVKGSGNLQTHS